MAGRPGLTLTGCAGRKEVPAPFLHDDYTQQHLRQHKHAAHSCPAAAAAPSAAAASPFPAASPFAAASGSACCSGSGACGCCSTQNQHTTACQQQRLPRCLDPQRATRKPPGAQPCSTLLPSPCQQPHRGQGWGYHVPPALPRPHQLQHPQQQHQQHLRLPTMVLLLSLPLPPQTLLLSHTRRSPCCRQTCAR